MNGPTDDSGWDSLDDMLGLGPASAATEPGPPAKKPHESKPVASPLPRPKPVADVEDFDSDFGGEIVEPAKVNVVVEHAPMHEPAVVPDIVETDFGGEVEIDEAPEPLEDEPETEGSPTAEALGGKRKRRRRRRKKTGTEATPDAAKTEGETAVVDNVATAEVATISESVESAADFEDDDEEDEDDHSPHDELGEDESAEPLPDMKVMAWTDLLATLYRPQERG